MCLSTLIFYLQNPVFFLPAELFLTQSDEVTAIENSLTREITAHQISVSSFLTNQPQKLYALNKPAPSLP